MIVPDTRYVAAVGCNHYFGFKIFKPGMPVRLEKDPDNPYDMEAIKVVIDPIGKVGYVANSTHTVPMGCQSAGRIYDTFDKEICGIVRFVTSDSVIIELVQQISFKYEVRVEVCEHGGKQNQWCQSRI